MRNACGINRTKIISTLKQENKKLLKCTSYAQNLISHERDILVVVLQDMEKIY